MYRIILALCCFALTKGQRIVDTQYGPVQGHVVNVNNGVEQTTVDVFYGIPFAANTSRENRFRSPVPPEPWTEIFVADTLPEACPQNGLSGAQVGEDCLRLNVYAPTDTAQSYAVMVWIYGGGYQGGANRFYPGHFLASRGVILVALNYRLNKFGFAYTANDACPGNAGMWDQAMGIQWVVDNIANFGGDPNKITVFGQSAGATSVSLHMLSPQTNTLFQQAIVESGAELTMWGLNPPESDPQNYTYAMAEDLGCSDPDDYVMMDCMRNKPWRQIRDASIGRCSPGFICLGMAPVVDGPGGFMPQRPAGQRMAGDVMQGPIIAGIAKEDGSLFAPVIAPLIFADNCCNRSYFERVLKDNLVGHFTSRASDMTLEDTFEAVNWMYSPWPYIFDTDDNRDKIVELTTDASFGVFWDRQLKDQSAIAPTWAYMFDYMSNFSNGADWVGTPHSAEIDYVFGFALLRLNPEVEEDSGISGGLYSRIDMDFSIFMQELWTNFAKFGNPTPTPTTNPTNGQLFSWPQFTEDDMNYVNMERSLIRNENAYRQKEYAFWGNYIMSLAGDELGVGHEWDDYNRDWGNRYNDGWEGIPNVLEKSWADHMSHLFGELNDLGDEETDQFDYDY